jgi:iron complex outermembrane receptor protein
LRKPFFLIRHVQNMDRLFFCAKSLYVRIFLLLFFGLQVVFSNAQSGLLHIGASSAHNPELPNGIVQGEIRTTDNQPAAFVTVQLRGTNKATITDDQGFFILKGIKSGTYILEVSLVGLQPQEKSVTIASNEATTVSLTLMENAQQLTDVVVRARRSLNERITAIGKLPVQPKDLPQSITVIDKGILERQQVQTVSDALQNVNGVYIMGTTGGMQEEIAARGYSFGSSNTFKNGARFNNGIRPEMSAVEKIEILKGGNAILYGNVGAGGVLNIVTKKPKWEQGGEILFRTGSYDFYKPVVDVYGSFTKKQVAAYRLNATYERARSFRDVVKSERFYINPSLLFKLTEKTELLVEGDYLSDNRTPDYGTGAIDYTVADVPRNTFLNVPWASNKTAQYTSTATLTHALSKNIGVRGLVSYQKYNNELFGAVRPNASGAMIASNGKWLRGLQRTKTTEDYYYASLDLNAQFKTASLNHTVLFGGDADKYNMVTSAFNPYSNPAITGNNKNVYDSINIFDPSTFNTRSDIPELTPSRITTSPIERYGVYVQDLISVLDNVKVLAGVRYTYQANRRAIVDTVAKGTQGFIAAYKNDAFSPRLGVVYQPCQTTSLFASYTNTFTVNTGFAADGSTLEPSVIDQYEAGIKNDFFKGALSANLTFYRIHNSNLAQASTTVAGARELTGATVSKGAELDIMTKPVHGFSVIAGYSYNDMRYTETREFEQDSRLRYNPAHTANASVFYSFAEKTAFHGLQLGLGAFYTGDRLAGRSTRTTVPNDTYRLMQLPDFVTVDANAGYVAKAFSVRVKLSNLFNKLSYYAHDDNSINPIAPRQFMATFSYKL